MAMNANPGGPDDEGPWGEGEGDGAEEVLACGRPLSSVWAEWDAEEGGDGGAAADPSAPAEAPHPRDCPYCQAARERLLLLNGYVSRLRTADAEEEARGTDVAASV
ncbi:hypothetical protein KDA82_01495, partial [Streptomyces daliensis]|nr:hypothetical protein [Streptomyces daliensis]